MGILDDAIREHLELKRRRGADPAEIERAEREALGPARRQYEAADEPGAELEPLADQDLIYEDEEEEWSEPVPETPAAGARMPPSDYADLDEPSAGGRWEEEPFDEEEPLEGDDRSETIPAMPAQQPGHGLEELETSEYDVTAEHEPEAEDVLEETPDFLQDTPDHDRLWFEQRPPRDFDFGN